MSQGAVKPGAARLLTRLWPFYLIVAVLGFALSQGWLQKLSVEGLRDNLGWLDAMVARNLALAVLAYISAYAICSVFVIPGWVLSVAGGALFGFSFGLPLIGAGAAVIGATIGASLLFLIARSSVGEALRDVAGPFLARMEAEFHAAPNLYLLALRLAPAMPFAVANIAPALLGVRFRDFVVTTFLGVIPGTFTYSWVGASAAAVLRDPNTSTSETTQLLQAMGAKAAPALLALFLVALLPALIKRILDTRKQRVP